MRSVVVLVLAVSLESCGASHAPDPGPVQVRTASARHAGFVSPGAQPHGLRSWVAKKLLRATAAALRSSKSQSVCRGLARFDGEEVFNAICRHRLTVSSTLDDLARWHGRLLRETVKDQLVIALTRVGLSSTRARVVAFHIATAIDWVIL